MIRLVIICIYSVGVIMHLFKFGLLSLLLGCVGFSLDAAQKRGLDELIAEQEAAFNETGATRDRRGRYARRAKKDEINAALAEVDHLDLLLAVPVPAPAPAPVIVPVVVEEADLVAEHAKALVTAACGNDLARLDELLAKPMTTFDMVMDAQKELRSLPGGVQAWRRHVFIKLFDAEKALRPAPVDLAPAVSADESDEDDEDEVQEVLSAPVLPSAPDTIPVLVAPVDAHFQDLITVAKTGDCEQLAALLNCAKTTKAIVKSVRADIRTIDRRVLPNKVAVLAVLNNWTLKAIQKSYDEGTAAVQQRGFSWLKWLTGAK